MKTDLFQSCGHYRVFQICWHIDCSTFTASSFRIWNSSTRIPSPPLTLFVVIVPKAHLTSHSRMSASSWVITPSWIDGKIMETVRDFILGGPKIIADGDCSHEIIRHFLLGRKIMTKIDKIVKSRDITLPTKVCIVKAMIFPVGNYGCGSWTIKKAEGWRI